MATGLWLAASALFSFYASHFGSYDATYRSWPRRSFCCSGFGLARFLFSLEQQSMLS
jgi:hypothetical protein